MKTISYAVTLIGLLWLVGCQQKEVQPANDFPDVPTAVVQAVKQAYPTATNLSFTELDKGKVWESDFSVQTVSHEAKVDVKGTILEAYAIAKADGVTAPQNVTLPTAAKSYIEKNYPTYKILAIGEGQYNNQKAYKVALRNEKEEITLIFDANGALVLEFKAAATPTTSTSGTGTTETPKTYPITKTNDLPATIVQYLNENGMTFAKGLISVNASNEKTYLVVATKGTTTYELTFNNAGKLIKSGSSTPAPAPTPTTEIKSINELPAAAIAFLNGYTFEKGSIITKEGKKIYSVVASKEGKRYEITFDADGKVLSNTYTPRVEEKAISSANELPGPITEYLNKNYVGWSFLKGIVVLSDTKPTSYTVVIKVGEIVYYVLFTGEGKFESVKK